MRAAGIMVAATSPVVPAVVHQFDLAALAVVPPGPGGTEGGAVTSLIAVPGVTTLQSAPDLV